MIEYEEIIHCTVWRKQFCDYHYKAGQRNIDGGIVHCDPGDIPEFFNRIKGTRNKYLVMSSCSDYGVCLQEHYPPWRDLKKAVGLFVKSDHGYQGIGLGPRIEEDACNEEDKYSIKCYSYTLGTFNEIPDNVIHWFTTNNMAFTEEKISGIPFGINSVADMSPVRDIYEFNQKHDVLNNEREKDVYVNFQFYTTERAELYNHYEKYTTATCERHVDYKIFLKQLFDHKFCICPNGNGVDCYRTWECFYTGCIPVVEICPGTQFLIDTGLPIIFSHSLYNLGHANLYPSWKNITENGLDLEAAKLSYWREKINAKRELLCAA